MLLGARVLFSSKGESYTPLKWIGGDGASWLLSNVYADEFEALEAVIDYQDTGWGKHLYLTGQTNKWQGLVVYTLVLFIQGGSRNITWGVSGDSRISFTVLSSPKLVSGTTYKLRMDIAKGNITLDDEVVVEFTEGMPTTRPIYPLPIMAQYDNYGNNITSQPVQCSALNSRFCSIKMWKTGNVLAHDLIPCLDPNGIVCMYDNVNSQFMYNQGTGNFIAGE